MVENFRLYRLLNNSFMQENRVYPDEMLHSAAAQLCLSCLLLSNIWGNLQIKPPVSFFFFGNSLDPNQLASDKAI